MTDKQTVKFGDICREVKLTTKDPIADGYERYIGLEHLDSGSLKIKRWGLITEDKPSFTRVFKKGQILFGKRRPYLKKAAIAEFDGICSGDIIVLEKGKDTAVSKLILLVLQSDPFWSWAVKTSIGSLSPRTKFKEIANFGVPKIDLYKADKISKAFNKSIHTLEISNLALESAKRLFNASLLELLRPQKNWTRKELGEIAEVKGGRQRSPKHADGEHIVPYLRPANIKRGKLILSDVLEMNFTPEEQKIYTLKKGDTLLVEGGEAEDVGDAAYWNLNDQHCYQNTLIRVRAKDAHIKPRHLFWVLTYLHRSGGFLGLAAGTKIKHIGTGNTSKTKVSLPSPQELDKACLVLDTLENYIYQLEISNEKVRDLSKSIVKKLYD